MERVAQIVKMFGEVTKQSLEETTASDGGEAE